VTVGDTLVDRPSCQGGTRPLTADLPAECGGGGGAHKIDIIFHNFPLFQRQPDYELEYENFTLLDKGKFQNL
jgi:hypothetical protein